MVGDFLFAFMFLRVYFVVRTILNFCPYSALYAKKVCREHKVTPDIKFCIKALMKKQPGSTVAVAFVISVMWLSYLLRIFER